MFDCHWTVIVLSQSHNKKNTGLKFLTAATVLVVCISFKFVCIIVLWLFSISIFPQVCMYYYRPSCVFVCVMID